ncbi:hypothetical protein QQP08_002546 [Theobroma cacao]|nr:hypothetical protein QQP08_002546 [Theobroma cacao]
MAGCRMGEMKPTSNRQEGEMADAKCVTDSDGRWSDAGCLMGGKMPDGRMGRWSIGCLMQRVGTREQHAKDEHIAPLLEQISKLEEALYNIQFEQHWIEAQTDRQAIGSFEELFLLSFNILYFLPPRILQSLALNAFSQKAIFGSVPLLVSQNLVLLERELSSAAMNTRLGLVDNYVNDSMGRRAIHKAMLESAALTGASILQVYLLRRLFERKLGTSRV